jgi:hypothetical protein
MGSLNLTRRTKNSKKATPAQHYVQRSASASQLASMEQYVRTQLSHASVATSDLSLTQCVTKKSRPKQPCTHRQTYLMTSGGRKERPRLMPVAEKQRKFQDCQMTDNLK